MNAGNIFQLQRNLLTPLSSSGVLYEPDGTRVCDTLEDTDRDLDDSGHGKIYGKTAIPYGLYEIEMRDSPHFKRKMPYLKDVPAFSGVMLHWGNTPADTLGCVLVGTKSGRDHIVNSRNAFDDLIESLGRYYANNETLYLQVTKSTGCKDERGLPA